MFLSVCLYVCMYTIVWVIMEARRGYPTPRVEFQVVVSHGIELWFAARSTSSLPLNRLFGVLFFNSYKKPQRWRFNDVFNCYKIQYCVVYIIFTSATMIVELLWQRFYVIRQV